MKKIPVVVRNYRQLFEVIVPVNQNLQKLLPTVCVATELKKLGNIVGYERKPFMNRTFFAS